MRTEGTLKTWNDDRGFGFATTAETKQEVFVHISSFPQTGRRPQAGERLAFSIETGADGKKRAVSVSYLDPPTAASLAEASHKARHATAASHRSHKMDRTAHRHGQERSHASGRRRNGTILSLLAICAIGAAILGSETLRGLLPSLAPAATIATSSEVPTTQGSSVSADGFQCDGRTHCSQMRSCAEAKYFLRNCPNAQMDGNGDGVPCEQQWCH